MKGLPLKGNFNRLGIESPRTHPAVNIPLEKIILENRTNRRFKQMFNDPRTGMFYILADNDLYCANYTFDDEGNFLLRDKELVSSTIHEQDRVEGTFIVIPFTRNGIRKHLEFKPRDPNFEPGIYEGYRMSERIANIEYIKFYNPKSN